MTSDFRTEPASTEPRSRSSQCSGTLEANSARTVAEGGASEARSRKAGTILGLMVLGSGFGLWGAAARVPTSPVRAALSQPISRTESAADATRLDLATADSADLPAVTFARSDPLSGNALRQPEGALQSDVVLGHRQEPDGRLTRYVHIPLRPGRSGQYGAYRWPVRSEPLRVLSGYDLDQPAERQRRIPQTGQVGHGAVDIAAKRGAPVWLVALEGQVGEPQVLYVGQLFGLTVVTLHLVQEPDGPRQYLVLLGHLSATPRAVQRRVRLRGRWELGFAGDSGSDGNVHVHVEARRVRSGVDPWKLVPSELVGSAHTVVCDPRNVFPMRVSLSGQRTGEPRRPASATFPTGAAAELGPRP